jgi:polysaccharide export outer membrane protein
MRKQFLAAALLLALSAGTRAHAADDKYLLGPDDVIDVTVPTFGDFDKALDCELVVLPDGTISYPEVGRIKAAGRSTDDVASEIKTALEKTRQSVNVVITVREIHSQHVRIVGAVTQGGSFDLKPNWRLLDVVAMAGGLSDQPYHVTGRLMRGNDVIPLDIPAAVAKPSSDSNVPIKNDDIIILDRMEVHNQVHILGQVIHPGAFDLEQGMGVLSLVAEGGGPTDRAALRNSYIIHSDQTQAPVDLYSSIVEGNSKTGNPALQAGDVVMIPEIQSMVAVMGDVLKPGYYPMPEKAQDHTVLKFLGMAGGSLPDADLARCVILRRTNGKQQLINIDIHKMMQKGAMAQNIDLQTEDVLYIPQRHSRLNLAEVGSPLSALGIMFQSGGLLH